MVSSEPWLKTPAPGCPLWFYSIGEQQSKKSCKADFDGETSAIAEAEQEENA
jgi:hypothetical protein